MSKASFVRIIIYIFFIVMYDATLLANHSKVPRFVSTKASEVNARIGPGIKYPIKWVFIKKGEPLEIINEFDQWRYVRDINNDTGWVHSSVLSLKRVVVICSNKIQNLYRSSNKESIIIAYVEPQVRCELKKCITTTCKLNCHGHIGWMDRKILWGVYDYE